jgi:release factor glutamine methyltransferase
MNNYTPSKSEEEIKKIKIFQEQVYEKLCAIKENKTVKVLDKDIITIPGMFAPIHPDAPAIAKCVREETKQGDVVLDMGCGTGVQGIFAAEKASKVVAVDINPKAVECAKLNAKKHNLNNIEVFYSDLFENINDKFDLITFNPPFRWLKPRDVLEAATTDENYKTLDRFFAEVKDYLKKDGKIILVFADSGDVKHLESLIKKANLKLETLSEKKSENDWTYYVFKLTP